MYKSLFKENIKQLNESWINDFEKIIKPLVEKQRKANHDNADIIIGNIVAMFRSVLGSVLDKIEDLDRKSYDKALKRHIDK
jgi:hypothetical protein